MTRLSAGWIVVLLGLVCGNVGVAREGGVIKREKLKPMATVRGWCDVKSVEHGDLMPHYHVVGKEDNAAPLLMDIGKKLVKLDAMRREMKLFRRGEVGWRQDFWDRMFRENQAAYSVLGQVLQRSWVQGERPVTYEASTGEMMNLIKMVHFLEHRFSNYLHKGQTDKAIGMVKKSMQLSGMALRSDGALVGWLVALGSYQRSIDMLERLLDSKPLTAEELGVIGGMVEELPEVVDRFCEACRYEHLIFRNLVNYRYAERLFLGDVAAGQAGNGHRGRLKQELRKFFVRLALQPNRTAAMHAAYVRHGIKLSKLPRWKRAKVDVPKVMAVLERGKGFTVGDFFSTNALGRVMLRLYCLVHVKQIDKIDAYRTQVGMLRVKLALRRYHDKHGQLPDGLGVLVPGYIESVPVDCFDGKQIRYSKAKARLWSVGLDLKDGGGMESGRVKPSYREMVNEPTFHLGFAEGR